MIPSTLTPNPNPNPNQEVMVDPVTTSDGQTYERREIFRWYVVSSK